MRTPDEYFLDLSSRPDRQPLAAIGEKVFDLVWRFDFATPGFCLLDLGPAVDSHTLRSWMLDLKERLSDLNTSRTGKKFAYRSMGRFDQQETTKFHLDGAPAASLLLLGYEPSKVHSRLFLADYSRCAFDLGVEPQRFLQDWHPGVFHLPGGLFGHFAPEQSADDVQAHVNTRRNARRADYPPVVHEAPVGVNLRVRGSLP
jgi:hypothetical protein